MLTLLILLSLKQWRRKRIWSGKFIHWKSDNALCFLAAFIDINIKQAVFDKLIKSINCGQSNWWWHYKIKTSRPSYISHWDITEEIRIHLENIFLYSIPFTLLHIILYYRDAHVCWTTNNEQKNKSIFRQRHFGIERRIREWERPSYG